MKRYIRASDDIKGSYSEAEIVSMLRSSAKQSGMSCLVKNGGIQVSSHEKDMYWFCFVNDLVDHVNASVHEYEDQFELEDDLVDMVEDVGESVGVRHHLDYREFRDKVKTLKSKYLGV